MTEYYNFEQGTPEWLNIRAGKLTASNMDKILTPAKLELSKQAGDYAMQLAAERILGAPINGASTWAMNQGHVIEENAKDVYSEHFAPIKNVGFAYDDNLKIGCSPDGLVGNDGGIEIKSHPVSAYKHIDTILKDDMPREYFLQVQTCLLVTGCQWWDFISAVEGMALYVKRIYPDLDVHKKITDASLGFDALVCDYVEKYNAASISFPFLEKYEIVSVEIA